MSLSAFKPLPGVQNPTAFDALSPGLPAASPQQDETSPGALRASAAPERPDDVAPLPDELGYGDACVRYWKNVTGPQDPPKVAKARMFLQIAQDQNAAGVWSPGLRTVEEAQVLLDECRRDQVSQAARTQDAFSAVGESLGQAVSSAYRTIMGLFASQTALGTFAASLETTLEGAAFKVTKNSVFSGLESRADAPPSRVLVNLVDHNHFDSKLQRAGVAFLARHFDPRRDWLLHEVPSWWSPTERAYLVAPPKELFPQHCMGVPLERCSFLREPPEMVAYAKALTAERRIVDDAYELLLAGLPRHLAAQVRAEFRTASAKLGVNPDTWEKMRLVIRYQDHCAREQRMALSDLVDPLTDASAVVNAKGAEVRAKREASYLAHADEVMQTLPPEGKVYLWDGLTHADNMRGRFVAAGMPVLRVDIDATGMKDEL